MRYHRRACLDMRPRAKHLAIVRTSTPLRTLPAMLRRRFLSIVPPLSALSLAPALVRNAYAQDGINDRTITIGSSGALSGPLAGFGVGLKSGVDAAMAQINEKGGIHGRQLHFKLVDDAYVPQRSVDNVKKMLADGSVFALMSCIGTPNNTAILPLVEDANVPYVAPLTGASSLRKPGIRNVFHVRASYTDETHRLVQKLVTMGIKNLAIVYLDNGFGKEVRDDAVHALQSQGIQATAVVALATDGNNMGDAVNQALAGKPAAVLLGTAGAASAGLITALRKASPMLPMAGLSVTLTADGVKNLGAAGTGLALTMVFPDALRPKQAIVRDYQTAMRAVGQSDLSSGSFEGYVNTRVLAEGLERAGRELTRSKLRSALAGIQKFDLGGFMVDFSAASPYVGSRYVDLGVLGASGRFLS
jgi:branched-chain amino acid transport system substrate-binding protein